MCRAENIHKVSLRGHTAVVRVSPAQSDAAPAILALHGFTGSGLDFLPLRKALGPSRFLWICPDFMGHGSSDFPDSLEPYSLEAALGLIDSARGFAPDPGRVLLLGYSMGGRLALHYLAENATMPAVLIGASPGLDSPTERESRQASDRLLASRILEIGMEAFVSEWMQRPLIAPQAALPEPLRSDLARRRLENKAVGLAHSLLATGTGSLPSLWERLPELSALTLVHGEKDTKFSAIAERMHRANPSFQVASIPGCGHAPHLENPEAIAQLIQTLSPLCD